MSRVTAAVRQVDAIRGVVALVVGGEVQRRGVRAPDDRVRAAVRLRRELALLAGRGVEQDERHPLRLVGRREREPRRRRSSAPSGEIIGWAYAASAWVSSVGVARRDVVADEVVERLGEALEHAPHRDDERAVRADVRVGLVEREAGDGLVEVARLVDPLLALGHGRRVQATQARTEVVVPVADRVVVEQQRLDAGVLARLRPLRVAREVARAALDVGAEHERVGVAGDGDPAHAALGRDEEPGLATRGRQGPQRVDLLVGIGLGVGVRTHRLEQDARRREGRRCRHPRPGPIG